MRISKSKINRRRLPVLATAVILLLGAPSWAVLPAAKAQSGTVTLKELKSQTPNRMQMTVTAKDGQTITVDAPIVLPEGDTLPIVLCRRATFDTSRIRDYYPLAKNISRTEREASTYWDHAGSPLMQVFAESKKDILRGKTDYSTRSSLPLGELPPLNDYTTEQAMQFIYRNIGLFECDTALDLRPLRAYAMGGLCRMKSVKVTEPDTGVSWREIVADPAKPIKGSEKGLWEIQLAQYMHGALLFGDYHPKGQFQPPENPNYWDIPVFLHARIMDEENCNVIVCALCEKEILTEDAPLLPYSAVENLIRERMESGKLQSVFQLTLGYSIKIVKGDPSDITLSADWNMDARYVLAPEWQILGFDEKDRENTKHAGYAPPSEEEILEPEIYGRYGLRYELRLDGQTGEPILDYAALEYDLKEKQ